MWLITQEEDLINLDNVTKIGITYKNRKDKKPASCLYVHLLTPNFQPQKKTRTSKVAKDDAEKDDVAKSNPPEYEYKAKGELILLSQGLTENPQTEKRLKGMRKYIFDHLALREHICNLADFQEPENEDPKALLFTDEEE